MTTPTLKLNWRDTSDDGRTSASYRGFTISAVCDEDASNPFEDWGSHWPMMVHYDRQLTTYDSTGPIGHPLLHMEDALLVHDQRAIAKVFGFDTISELLGAYSPYGDDEPEGAPVYCRDAERLRNCFVDALYDVSDSKTLGKLAELYEIAGVPHLHTTSTGYCQGDWAELLIVAPSTAQEKLRSQPADMDDATWASTLRKDMQGQVKLYSAWAWGDVYGYTIERGGKKIDASCWGFYGNDFAWSGLEEAAMDDVDCVIRAARKARCVKLRDLVTSRVPLRLRAALLDQAERAVYG